MRPDVTVGTGRYAPTAVLRAAVVVVANSPGEISGWVRPVVARLRSMETTVAPRFDGLYIVVVVPPCPFASGRETEVAAAIAGVDAVVGPSEYLKYAVLGRVPKGLEQVPDGPGIVAHLGGDPMHSALLSRRLGFPAVLYSDRTAGFVGSFARFMAEDARVEAKLRRKGVPADKIAVVGNLMIDGVEAGVTRDAARASLGVDAGSPLVCLMPGSRKQQIYYAMPFFLRVAEIVKKFHRGAEFVAVLSPYVGPSMVSAALSAAESGQAPAAVADTVRAARTAAQNGSYDAAASSGADSDDEAGVPRQELDEARWVARHGGYSRRGLESARARLVPFASPISRAGGPGGADAPEPEYLIMTEEGATVRLVTDCRYGAMAASDVAVTMPGSVTAELAFLGVPTVVAVPTNIPEEVPLPGLIGLVGGIPLVGRHFKRIGVQKAIERIEFTAIPNKRQRRMVTPEVKGIIGAHDVAIKVLELLQDAKVRGRIALELRQAMGQPGASARVASVILETLATTGGRRG